MQYGVACRLFKKWCSANPGDVLDGVTIDDRDAPYNDIVTKEKGELFFIFLSNRISARGERHDSDTVAQYMSALPYMWKMQNKDSREPCPSFVTEGTSFFLDKRTGEIEEFRINDDSYDMTARSEESCLRNTHTRARAHSLNIHYPLFTPHSPAVASETKLA